MFKLYQMHTGPRPNSFLYFHLKKYNWQEHGYFDGTEGFVYTFVEEGSFPEDGGISWSRFNV